MQILTDRVIRWLNVLVREVVHVSFFFIKSVLSRWFNRKYGNEPQRPYENVLSNTDAENQSMLESFTNSAGQIFVATSGTSSKSGGIALAEECELWSELVLVNWVQEQELE